MEVDARLVYDYMRDFAVGNAANILLAYRGKVKDKGKEQNRFGIDQEEGGLALTVVDEILQELFLAGIHERFGAKQLRINCEEKTPLKHLFLGNRRQVLTVHQDPLDGTKPYLEGKDDFATGYGLSDKDNNFTHAVICAPARNRIYLAQPGESKILDMQFREVDEIEPRYNVVFSKRILNDRGRVEAEKAGMVVKGVESAHCRISDVAFGYGGAYLYGMANPHDSFIPFPIASNQGVTLTDISGKEISGRDIVVSEKDGLPLFERVPSVVYIARDNPYKSDLMNILADKKNLENLEQK